MDNHENMSDSKTWAIIAAVVVVLVAIAIVAFAVANVADNAVTHQRSQMDMEETQARINPVGQVNLASNPNPDLGKVEVAAADEAPAEFSAESAYNTSCAACHAAGVMGAPKMGDAGAWSSRIAQGKATLYLHAINGIGTMPPRGGSSLNDDQIKAVVDYMVEKSQ